MVPTPLSILSNGDKAEVLKIRATGEIRRRLLDMGLAKGVHLKVLRKAPLGDPIEIFLKGFNLSLRLAEAEKIDVKKIGETGDGKPIGQTQRRRHGQGGHHASE